MMKKKTKVQLKQILGLLFTVIILCGCLSVRLASASEDLADQKGNPANLEEPSFPLSDGIWRNGDYLYRVLEDGTAEIVEYLSDEEITQIPSVLAGYPVSVIGERAFSNQGNINYYTDEYPDYHRAGIQRIRLPEGLIRIGAYAFEDCFNLRSVILPSSLRVIEEGAFADCHLLMNITLPDQIEELGAYAFRGCHALISMNLPASLKKIGANPFADCSHFRRVDLAVEHPFLRFEGGMLYDSKEQILIACMLEAWKSPVSLPDSIRIIGEAAFAGAPVETIVIPESVTTVGSYAFADSALKKLVLSSSLEALGDNPIRNCPLLSDIELRSERFVLRNGALIDETEHRLIACLPPALPNAFQTEYTKLKKRAGLSADSPWRHISLSRLSEELGAKFDIWDEYWLEYGGFPYMVPNRIQKIGASAFWGLPVQTIEIPDSVNSIGPDAFSHCRWLESCRLPSRLKKIENGLFYDCGELSEVTFPEELQMIGAYAFSRSGIQQAILPDTVTSIGAYAFADCHWMENFHFSEALTEIQRGAFTLCGIGSLDLPAGLTKIGIQAFSRMSNLYEIDLPEGLTVIPDFSFFDTPVYSISIPSGVRYIGDQAFRIDGYSFPQMVSIAIPEELHYLGNKAFMGQSQLEEITLPGSLGWIGKSAFEDCNSLVKAVFSEGITTLPEQMFYRSGLKEIRLPETMKKIGSRAFSETPLVSVELPGQELELTGNPFWRCSSLSHVVLAENHPNLVIRDHLLIDESRCQVIALLNNNQEVSCVVPEGIQVINEYAMGSKLKEVKLPDSVREIRAYAFCDCKLESIVLPEQLERIGAYAFADNPLTEIRFPERLREIGEYAFSWTNLSEVEIPSSIERIGTCAFNTSSLKQITFQLGEVELEGNPFMYHSYAYSNEDPLPDPKILIPENHPTLRLSNGNLYSVQDHRLIAQLTNAPIREDTVAVACEALNFDIIPVFSTGIRELSLTDENFYYGTVLDECYVVTGSACEAFLEAGVGWPSSPYALTYN